MDLRSQSVRIIHPLRHSDARGWITESYNITTFTELGIDTVFVQDNHSFSAFAYTLRGLHFQTPPHAQAKLVRCIRGSIYDVAVDIRLGSPTYGKWVSAELSANNGCQLYIPIGFAHGFLTLEPGTEVVYKCSGTYSPSHDDGVKWNSVGIDWPLPIGKQPELSAKDQAQQDLAYFKSEFGYDDCPLVPLAS